MIYAKLLDRIKEPQTIVMAKKSRELKSLGIDITDLSLGEPDFDTPKHIKDAAKIAMDEGWTKYTPVAGLPELRTAICTKLKRDNNLDYTPDQIVVSTGAKQSLSNILGSIINEGDEVIIPTPYWVTYSAIVEMYGGKCVYIHCNIDDNFKLTPQKLESALNDNTKAIIYSSPCNPTGIVYSHEELKALKDVLLNYPNTIIISDEIYEYINFSGPHHSIAQFDEIKERVVVVNGCSKGFAMTGWRLGYLAATPKLAKACELIQSQITSGTNSITQRAAITALLGTMQPTEDMKQAYKTRRDYFINALNNINGFRVAMPEGAFYAFANVSAFFGKKFNGVTLNNADDFAMFLLEQGHVTGVSGAAFGNDNCIRFSFATSIENLKKAIAKIQKVVPLLTD